jgi:hypothetical protein
VQLNDLHWAGLPNVLGCGWQGKIRNEKKTRNHRRGVQGAVTLAKRGAKVELVEAVESCDAVAVRNLIANGANVNRTDDRLRSPLHVCCRSSICSTLNLGYTFDIAAFLLKLVWPS